MNSPLRRALKSPGFRPLFAARLVSQWGDAFNAIALVVFVYQLTGSGLRVATTVAFEILPVISLGFVAGAAADRLPRRAVMIGADLARAAIAVVLAVFGDSLAVLYACAFGLSAGAVFFNPAASAVLPALVDRDDLVGANSAIWSSAVISQVALAPLAGGLVAWAGASPAFIINAGSFLVSASLLTRMPLPDAPPPPAGRRLEDIAEGFRAIRASRFLGTLAITQAVAALSAGATSALLVVLASRHLHIGPGRFGILLAAIGIGAGLGPLVLQRLIKDVRRPGWLFGPYILRGAVDLVLGLIASFTVALGALAAYGIGTSTGNVTYNSVLQSAVPDRLRGRIFSFYDVIWQTARLVSIGAGGVAADAFGIRSVYIGAGGLLLLAGAFGLTRLRRGDLLKVTLPATG